VVQGNEALLNAESIQAKQVPTRSKEGDNVTEQSGRSNNEQVDDGLTTESGSTKNAGRVSNSDSESSGDG